MLISHNQRVPGSSPGGPTLTNSHLEGNTFGWLFAFAYNLHKNQSTQKDIKTIDKLYQTKPDYYDSLIIAKEIEQGKH